MQINLDITDVRCQSYDSIAAISEAKSAFTKPIRSPNGKCLYTYCNGHALKLAVGYMTKKDPSLNGTFDTVSEILLNIVKKS